MELRLAEIECRRADRNVCAPSRTLCAPSRLVFVTYAVEIEGEAPLIFVAEAADA
jgi:hypothetical protein